MVVASSRLDNAVPSHDRPGHGSGSHGGVDHDKPGHAYPDEHTGQKYRDGSDEIKISLKRRPTGHPLKHKGDDEHADGNGNGLQNGYQDADSSAEEFEDDFDPGVIHKSILDHFDKTWTPLAHDDPDYYKKVTAFISKHEKDEDLKGLNMRDTEGKTLLQRILTAPAPKLKGQSQTRRDTFDRRRDLFKWLMETHKDLYKGEPESENMGYSGYSLSVFELVIQRLNNGRLKADIRKDGRQFVEFFVQNYPKQTASLLKIDAATGDKRIHKLALIHQLLPMLSSTRNLGSLALLHHLDRETVLQRDLDDNTVLHLASAYGYLCDESKSSQLQLLESIKKLLEICEEALRCTNSEGQSPYQYRVATYKTPKLPNSQDETKLTVLEDQIAQYLKERYMHFDKRDEIIKYLHGDVQECEIHVNLEELSQINAALSKADIEGLLENLKLENILQCVRIPKYQLETQIKTTTARKYSRPQDTAQDGAGRKDYEQIFDLLWKKKGVKKIINIKVEDDEHSPHSDEVLERLERFDIEEWDWDRADICSDVLAKAAPNLRKVTLYSSGNNAVLRSWSGTDGLNQLTKLEKVHVVIHQGLEPRARVDTYKSTFLKRMKRNCDESVTVTAEVKTDSKGKESTKQASFNGEQEATAWLKTMDKFARFITNLPPDAYPESAPGVKVAILDDGIDGIHGGFGREHLKEGISFLMGRDENVRPFCFSSIGHGTNMATLIRRVCPHVQLYVVRLNQYSSTDGNKMQPTPESAALGIQWAIRKKVDIISMSWTIAKTDGNKNKEGLDALEQALKEAREANILMFGSASDQGWNDENPILPSGFHGVFCIGAANSSGNPEAWAEKEARYVLPGASGSMAARSAKAGEDQASTDAASSSSFATALGAGLAALILYCIDLTEAVPPQNRKILTKYEVMRDIYDKMCSENKRYITAKKYFDPKFANMSWDEDSKKKLKGIVDIIIRPYTDNQTRFGGF